MHNDSWINNNEFLLHTAMDGLFFFIFFFFYTAVIIKISNQNSRKKNHFFFSSKWKFLYYWKYNRWNFNNKYSHCIRYERMKKNWLYITIASIMETELIWNLYTTIQLNGLKGSLIPLCELLILHGNLMIFKLTLYAAPINLAKLLSKHTYRKLYPK